MEPIEAKEDEEEEGKEKKENKNKQASKDDAEKEDACAPLKAGVPVRSWSRNCPHTCSRLVSSGRLCPLMAAGSWTLRLTRRGLGKRRWGSDLLVSLGTS